MNWITKGIGTFVIPKMLWPLLGLLAIGMIQSIAWHGNENLRNSLSLDVDATRSVSLVILYLIIWGVITASLNWDLSYLKKLIWMIPAYGSILAVLALLQKFTTPNTLIWLRETRIEGFGPFVNRNHFAGYMELLLAFPLAFLITKLIDGEMRWLYGAAAGLMGIALLFTLSRGGAVALVTEILFVVAIGQWWQKKNSMTETKPWAPIIAGIAIVILIIVGAIWIGAEPILLRIATGDQTGKSELADYSSGRGEIWMNSWQIFRAYPLLGVGLGAYETVYPRFRGDSLMNGVVGETHNDYLQLLTDTGLVGGFLGLGFIFLIIVAIRKLLNEESVIFAGFQLGALGAIFGILIHSFFDFNLHLPSHSTLLIFWITVVSLTDSPNLRMKFQNP